ncbi:MAG TPA: hypothetical protein VFG68_23075 [Fimbriiglobus sp.]|nr:hypothetical protein [Fimbriiglobus sp.]
MPIPELVDNVLPEGVHDCTIEEVEAVFGRFQKSDKRMRLTEKLRTYLDEARRSGLVKAVIVDGSYVMGRDEPEDIDLIVVLPADWGFTRDLKPSEYNVVTRVGIIRRKYPFDVFTYADGSERYLQMLEYFSQVNPLKHAALTEQPRKGVLRVVL